MVKVNAYQPDRRSTVFKFEYNGEVDHFVFLLASDLHLDNPHCDRTRLRRDLDKACEREAFILLNGDLLCVMQGKGDPRHRKKDTLARHGKNYFNDVIDDAYEFLRPYAGHILFIGKGNHESKIEDHLEIDLLGWLTQRLRQDNDKLQYGGYSGYITLHFTHSSGGAVRRYIIGHHHGWGGGGATTKGINQFTALRQFMVGVDALWMGHVHYSYHNSERYEMLNNRHRTEVRTLDIIRTSTYKEEFHRQEGGFHIEKAGPPKPLGGYWLELKVGEVIKRKIYDSEAF